MSNSHKNAFLPTNISSGNADRKPAVAAGVWRLGDLLVHRIGFGTKRLAGPADTGRNAVELLRRAVELGVNHIDTAAFYPTYSPAEESRDSTGPRWANDAIRRALAPYPDELVIATKVGPTGNGQARPDQLPALVEHDLRTLGREVLDVVYLRQHGLDSVAEHFGVLADLRAKGLIRHLALSNVRAHHVAQAQEIAPVVAVQNRYGVGFGRINDEMVRSCREQGIAFVPFFAVTATGREAGGVASSDTVLGIARAYGATSAQIRIAWTLSRGSHVLAIPGTGNIDHLDENVAAGAIQLSAEHLAVLDALESKN